MGGASPLPLPAEIRALTGYSPTICFAIEGNTTKWFGKDSKWGMTLGLRLETKGMDRKSKNQIPRLLFLGSYNSCL